METIKAEFRCPYCHNFMDIVIELRDRQETAQDLLPAEEPDSPNYPRLPEQNEEGDK